MTRSRRRTSFPTRSGTPSRYVWVPGDTQIETTPANSLESSADLLVNYFNDSGRVTGPGMVIERIFGTLIVQTAVVNSVSPFMCGLQMVREDDTAVRISPKTEIGRFLWWMADECPIEASEVAAGVFIPKRAVYHFEVHSRAKLTSMAEGMRLQMQNDDGENVLTWSIYTRTLLRVS